MIKKDVDDSGQIEEILDENQQMILIFGASIRTAKEISLKPTGPPQPHAPWALDIGHSILDIKKPYNLSKVGLVKCTLRGKISNTLLLKLCL